MIILAHIVVGFVLCALCVALYNLGGRSLLSFALCAVLFFACIVSFLTFAVIIIWAMEALRIYYGY